MDSEAAAPPRLTLRFLFHEMAERFFNLEKGWLRTARELTTGPGAMIRRYVETDRKSYANPLSYLVMATAVSIVVQSVAGVQERLMGHFQSAAIESPDMYQFANEVNELIFRNILYVSFAILIPFAILMRLLCRRSGVNLAESFVFAFFAGGHAAFIGLFLIALLLLTSMHPTLYAVLGITVSIAYYSYAAVGFFGGRVATVLKTIVAFFTGYGFLMIVAMAGAVIYVLAVRTPTGEPWDLVRAADGNVVEAAKKLLEDGAEVDMTRERTALHVAAGKGHAEMVDLLLDNGADVDARDHLGRVPMYIALSRDHLDVARRLAKAGTDATARSSEGDTLLMMALRREDAELVKWALEGGADVNNKCQGRDLATALMIAARSRDAAMVGLLLEHGADPGATNDDGETALDLARGKEVEELLRAAATASTP